VVTPVLETSEQLSAQLLGTMTNWMKDDDMDSSNSNSYSNGSAASQGMIVDGALSLSALEISSNSNSHVWISQKAMQQSNYQLVGVN
jgi:hypothetical protein